MEISESQTDAVSLTALAVDTARMLCAGQFDALADAYGYALAYDREPSSAIEEDLSACLAELGAPALAQSQLPPIVKVKYFKPGDHSFFALAECVLPTTTSGSVLLELIVTSGTQKHAYLEQISVVD